MREILLSKKSLVSTLTIACLYIVLATYLMNTSLLKSTLSGAYSITYKLDLLVALLGGMWTAMSGFGLSMLILTALLTGANLTLIAQRAVSLKSSGKVHFVAGGSSLLGFIGSGCVACGLPILALLGLSGSITYLPFRGAELSVISVALLSLSFYLMTRNKSKDNVCEID